MSKFIEGQDRSQGTLFPERLDDYVEEDSPVRVIDVFIDDLDISGLGFRTELAATGRPRYHPKTMLKLYVYGYLNRVQSSRRLEVEAQRNIELPALPRNDPEVTEPLDSAVHQAVRPVRRDSCCMHVLRSTREVAALRRESSCPPVPRSA